jgi:hypothetical protein
VSSLDGALLSGVELTRLMSPRLNSLKRFLLRFNSMLETSKPSKREVLATGSSELLVSDFFDFLAKDLTGTTLI